MCLSLLYILKAILFQDIDYTYHNNPRIITFYKHFYLISIVGYINSITLELSVSEITILILKTYKSFVLGIKLLMTWNRDGM